MYPNTISADIEQPIPRDYLIERYVAASLNHLTLTYHLHGKQYRITFADDEALTQLPKQIEPPNDQRINPIHRHFKTNP